MIAQKCFQPDKVAEVRPQYNPTQRKRQRQVTLGDVEAQMRDEAAVEAEADEDGLVVAVGEENMAEFNRQLLEEEAEVFTSIPVKSRRMEQDLFGKPNPTVHCFGCEYLDDYSSRTTIPEDDVEYLRKMARDCFGRMTTATLANGMSNFYEDKIRARINRNLQPGENPLPPWSPAQVLEHLRYHHQDPVVKMIVLLEEVEELRTELYDQCLEESSRNKRIRANSRIINDYDKVVKLQLHIQSKDPTKLAFFAPGARINPDSTNQGVFSLRGKKLHTYMKQ